MGGLNLTVHPLFFAFGFYYALTGRIFVFLSYTVCAVIHELGHSFVASAHGYKLNKITLMPFGAVVCGDTEGMLYKDEIKIALAGPLLNLAIGLFFVASWWVFPSLYAFTDISAEANFTMASVNFLPVYPLDGGRVLHAISVGKYGSEKAEKICKISGGVFSLLLFVTFVITLFYTVNVSLLFFALFVFFGVFFTGKENKYVRLSFKNAELLAKRGAPVKIFAVDENASVRRVMNIVDENAVNEIFVFRGKEKVAVLNSEKLDFIFGNAELTSPIKKFLS